MGPQHPSTHGVLRLVVELEGETVTDMRTVIGYLHTGIEKNVEFRTWTQAVTFLTRADYLAPLFNETVYCLGVEKLLGVEVPRRAQLIRLMLMEINRVSSHWVALATGGMEMGALTAMTNGLRARERCLDILELITGLRMNHAYVRPGGVAQDLPDGAPRRSAAGSRTSAARSPACAGCCRASRSGSTASRTSAGSGSRAASRSGVTGPMLRAAGLPWDLRKTEPYLGLRRASTSTSRPRTAPTAGRASSSGSTRWTSRCASSSRCSTASSPARCGSTTRRSPGRPSSASAPTAWATRSSTCRRS